MRDAGLSEIHGRADDVEDGWTIGSQAVVSRRPVRAGVRVSRCLVWSPQKWEAAKAAGSDPPQESHDVCLL